MNQSKEQPRKGKEETVRQIAWIAWKGAANAFRLYPDNNHTFTDYWDGAKSQFDEYSQTPIQSGEERLKGIIEKMFKDSKTHATASVFTDQEKEVELKWQQFKTENQL